MSSKQVEAPLGIALVLVVSVVVILAVILAQRRVLLAHPSLTSRASEALSRNDNTLAGSGDAESAVSSGLTKVIPLQWQASASIYVANFKVGVSSIEAAFDTGSARFIVATNQCGSCSGRRYDPAASNVAIALIDPRKEENLTGVFLNKEDLAKYEAVLCTTQVSYVSQTDKLQMYQDTVTFPRSAISQTQLCSRSVDQVMTSGTGAAPLVITDFPVGGIVGNTGSSSLNVLGMSGVLSITTIERDGRTEYLLPSCQTSREVAYESALIEAIAMFYRSRSMPVIWSQYIGDSTGFMLFAPLRLACLDTKFTPMIKTLTNASSALVRTPWRYYVVPVLKIEAGKQNKDRSTYTTLPNPPKYVLIDTGTTQFLLPGASGAINASHLSRLEADELAIVTLGTSAEPIEIVYSQEDITYNTTFGRRNVFSSMPDSMANVFSSNKDIGIMGVTGMRHMYIEYDLTKRRLGIGMPRSTNLLRAGLAEALGSHASSLA